MQQVWISKTGAPEVLELREAPDPAPGEGEVQIAVRATGINFADILARMGMYPDAPPIPCVVGYEVAGIVSAVGAGVREFREGDRVFALTRFGGYASMVSVPAVQVFAMPSGASFEEAASIPVNYFTAHLGMFFQGNLKEGERFLIHSAGGGVGLAAIQLAQLKNAEIFGTASASKHAFLKERGLHHAIDYRTQDFEAEVRRITNGKGVHLIMDAVGGKSFEKSYRSLGDLGRLVMFGISSAATGKRRSMISLLATVFAMPKFKPFSLINKNKGVFGLNLGHLWDEIPVLRYIGLELVQLFEAGKIKPHIGASFPLSQAAEAHRFIQDRKNTGKVVMTVD